MGTVTNHLQAAPLVPPHQLLKERNTVILDQSDLTAELKWQQIKENLAEYKAKDLPTPTELGLSQPTWLAIYWDKLGQERGKPLAPEENQHRPKRKSAWRQRSTI